MNAGTRCLLAWQLDQKVDDTGPIYPGDLAIAVVFVFFLLARVFRLGSAGSADVVPLKSTIGLAGEQCLLLMVRP